MTNDDRAFIRGILSDPTSDTARLVYADFLDEQEDPRGEFLRLEVSEARGDFEHIAEESVFAVMARTTAQQRLRELRDQLDPTWLAMIERPPVEKCPQARPRFRRTKLHFEFECPKKWDRLELTDDDTVRHCSACQKDVYFCHSLNEAIDHAWRRECVAVAPQVPRHPRDLDVEETVTMGLLISPSDHDDPGDFDDLDSEPGPR